MPDTEVVRLRELFRNEPRLADGHSGYDWTPATVRDLLADFRRLHERRQAADGDLRDPGVDGPKHHLGTVVLRETDDGLAVVDGYARLLVVAVVLDILMDDPPVETLITSITRHGGVDSSSGGSWFTHAVSGEMETRLDDTYETVWSWIAPDQGHYGIEDTLLHGVTVTVHRVDSRSEATAVRAAATRPGTATTETERVANGLAARCRPTDPSRTAKEVTSVFGELKRTTSDAPVEPDDLLRAHWQLYWEPNWDPDSDGSVSERVLQGEQYAANERADAATADWITAYLDGLRAVTKAHGKLVTRPDEAQVQLVDFLSDSVVVQADRLRRLVFARPVATSPLALAAAVRFDASDRVLDLLDLLQTTLLRAKWVRGDGTVPEAVESRRRRGAFELVWAGRAEEYRSADRDPPFETPNSPLAGYDRAWRRLQSAVGRVAPDAAFEQALTREDVREGTRAADGWLGVDDDTLGAPLASYERHELDDDRVGRESPDDLESSLHPTPTENLIQWLVDSPTQAVENAVALGPGAAREVLWPGSRCGFLR